MLINLSDVLSEQHKPIRQTVEFEMNEIQMKSGKYQVIHKLPVEVHVSHMKNRELQIQGKMELSVVMACDRCLEDVEVQMPLEFTKFVNLAVDDAELPEGFDESNYIDGYNLDVDKMLYNEILVGWPTKVLCRDDCKGICNVCGQNLNMGTCDCEDTGLDPRMSVVRDLFKNFKEV
ncbi:MAG: DUF177 domain-containing protein [Schaedlerella sp.]|nr:DUF177 domain-containing protein [Schaedlerella sp.]